MAKLIMCEVGVFLGKIYTLRHAHVAVKLAEWGDGISNEGLKDCVRDALWLEEFGVLGMDDSSAKKKVMAGDSESKS